MQLYTIQDLELHIIILGISSLIRLDLYIISQIMGPVPHKTS